MELKFCPNCGASVPENSKFCLSCGTNLSTIASQPTASITESSPITSPKIISNSNVTDLEVSTARMKSYTGTAIFVFFLYLFFYFPGVIVNYIYLEEAKKMEEKAGMSLPGVNILNIMMQINSVAVVLSICITAVIVIYIFSR